MKIPRQIEACTAERFFRIDRAQEHLHYLIDIASEIMYILDQENPTLPATPEDETASGLYGRRNPNFSSGSSENLGRESQGNTPSSPSKNQKFFERSGSGPGSSDSGLDNSRKCKSSTFYVCHSSISRIDC